MRDGAFKHVMADLMGSVGVVISGVIVILTGWVLLGGVPEHIDLYALCADIEDVPGVTLIHDVHVFTVTSNFDLMTAHVLVDPDFRGYEDEMQRQLRRIATELYGIHHVTFQLCHTADACTEDHHVGHLAALSRSPG